ncbi:PEPxxWA-CTERM sorting domain-containing protein [Gimibacter soli]|uniref:PEPxxWA-CTERM sorting domain-containing protein n=1 Tax=Gimibacter soli TaxID=3024400 RepID=A0AAE9XTY4_9PROT|nr:PEPxxWA-CTERM sorting domain-containing protein [Gimibacter soli]WCL54831.1 PEPxxWA-CTERM sorting domain-containing protein [Gimibacter soli]
MKYLKNILAAAALTATAAFAAEAAVTFTATDGGVTYSIWEGPNDEPASNADWAAFLAETGYYQVAKYDVPDEENPGGFTGETFTITGTPGKSGTWSSSFGVNGFVIKGSNTFLFVDYGDLGAQTGDNWCTDGTCKSVFADGNIFMPQLLNNGGKNPGLSHLSLYVLSTVPVGGIPEPATWLMMIMGFGLVGVATRRRTHMARTIA